MSPDNVSVYKSQACYGQMAVQKMSYSMWLLCYYSYATFNTVNDNDFEWKTFVMYWMYYL